MKLRTGLERKRARVEMIPLIDVVFLLLVFFIYAMLSMSVQRGIPVNLPEASTSDVRSGKYVVVVVSEDGSLYVNDTKVERSDLIRRVEEARGKELLPVHIRGDGRAPLRSVVFVMDELGKGGIREVVIETEEAR